MRALWPWSGTVEEMESRQPTRSILTVFDEDGEILFGPNLGLYGIYKIDSKWCILEHRSEVEPGVAGGFLVIMRDVCQVSDPEMVNAYFGTWTGLKRQFIFEGDLARLGYVSEGHRTSCKAILELKAE